jgi:lysozyme
MEGYLAQLKPKPFTAEKPPAVPKPGALMQKVDRTDLPVYENTILEKSQEITARLAKVRSLARDLGTTHGSLFNPDDEAPITDEDNQVEESTSVVGEESNVDNLTDFVIQFEGFSEKPYDDYGQLSIGYGTKATGENQVVTKEQARELLQQELQRSRQSVLRAMEKYNYDFTENQILALTSFTYNLGSGEGTPDDDPEGLKQLLDSGRRGVEEISDSIELYNRAGGKVLPGLVKRRAAEYKLFNEGFTS